MLVMVYLEVFTGLTSHIFVFAMRLRVMTAPMVRGHAIVGPSIVMIGVPSGYSVSRKNSILIWGVEFE